jgi:hypothetical protein
VRQVTGSRIARSRKLLQTLPKLNPLFERAGLSLRLPVGRERPAVPDDRKIAADCRRRAAKARRMADAASTPAERADLLAVERRWLTLARNHEAKAPAPSKKKHRPDCPPPHRGRNGGGRSA